MDLSRIISRPLNICDRKKSNLIYGGGNAIGLQACCLKLRDVVNNI